MRDLLFFFLYQEVFLGFFEERGGEVSMIGDAEGGWGKGKVGIFVFFSLGAWEPSSLFFLILVVVALPLFFSVRLEQGVRMRLWLC